MQEKYRRHMKWWLDEFCAGDQVDRYVELFPELDSRLAKFAVGIFLWNMEGEIDITNPADVNRVHEILKVLDNTPGYYFFDNVFNECSPDVVCEIIGISPKTPREELPVKADYTVFAVNSWEEAKHYQDMVPWSIAISEEEFKAYAATGKRFYLCRNDEWWDAPCIPGKNFPHDTYGYSLIAVEVSSDNEIVSISSRWNTYAEDGGHFLTGEQLSNLIGDKEFSKLLDYGHENH